MKVLDKSYLILAIVFGAAGLVQCLRWGSFGSLTVGYLVNFLPAAAFAVAHLARRKGRLPAHAAAALLGIPSVLAMAFFGVAVEMLIAATRTVTDVAEYEEVLDRHWSSDANLVAHFPRPIPPDASGVRFSFTPAFLQGGAHIQLRCCLPAERISQLHEEFSARRTKSFFGGDKNDHMNVEEGMPTTFFYTSGSEQLDFPDDYEIMIFDEVLEEEDRPPGFYWNHGTSHGVAVSKTRGEIVYWAESW